MRSIDSIFCDALEIESEEERAAFLDEACNGDADLRARVDRLLLAEGRSGSFMADTEERPGVEKPGTRIGAYKLLNVLGEGGMGVVYMAEQTEPVERRVAFKIVKPGMDSREFIVRFEAERQALAMMDHPSIAKVLDAGETEDGRPYLVMELVRGIPINEYCDGERLTTKQRLELFVRVCNAVHHAHQKGIIHRDLKPSNVLVAEYDHKPVPKVIDFGVAKAASVKLTDKTMFTEHGQILGIGPPLTHDASVRLVAFASDAIVVTGTATGTMRFWDASRAPLQGDVKRIALWIQVCTGFELDASGRLHTLDSVTWLARRERLTEMGGPPMTR